MSTEVVTHASRPKTKTSVKNVAKVTDIIDTDTRNTTRPIASIVNISLGATHIIL
jgi:hypothetical protein